MSVEYLTVDTVIAINKRYGGDGAGVVDRGGLEGAVARPQSGSFDQEFFPDVWLKAAVLLQSLARTQYFHDGNKRTAWLSALTFLELNGEEIRYVSAIEAEPFVLAAAVTSYTYEQVAEWLKYQRVGETRLTSAMLCGKSAMDGGVINITGGGITFVTVDQRLMATVFVALVLSSDFGVRDSVVVSAELFDSEGSRQLLMDPEGQVCHMLQRLCVLEKSGPVVPGEPWQLNLSLPYPFMSNRTGRHRLQLTVAADHDSAQRTVVSLPFAVVPLSAAP